MMVYFQNKSKHILLHKYFLKNAPFAWLERKKKENATKSNIEFFKFLPGYQKLDLANDN